MSRNQLSTKGFTIIELMLAMTFVSFLLVGIAMLTIQMSTIYTRGLTMKEINQAGTEITDDIRRSIGESTLENVQSTVKNGNLVLCTGMYSYITNSPSSLEEPGSPNVKFFGNNNPVRLAKVRDTSARYCTSNLLASPNVILEDGAVELLGGGDRSLVVRELSLDDTSNLPADDKASGRMLFTVRLTLSTGIDDEIQGTACRPPDDNLSGDQYCAINTFVIVSRVGNTIK